MKNMDYIKGNYNQFCMHAGGMVDGEMLTNTRQALYYWIDYGMQIFEFDICKTDDQEYVTCHDFNTEAFRQLEVINIPVFKTSNWFISQNLYYNGKGPYNAMTLDFLFSLLEKEEIKMLMIDPKDFSYDGTIQLLEYISQLNMKHNIIDIDRVVVELYNYDMIEASTHFSDIAKYQYCVDDDIQQGNSIELRSLSPIELIAYLQAHNIGILSYPWKQAVENLSFLKLLINKGFKIWSRTRNNIFYELLDKVGIAVNIIDEHITPPRYSDQLIQYKEEYLTRYQPQIEKYFK